MVAGQACRVLGARHALRLPVLRHRRSGAGDGGMGRALVGASDLPAGGAGRSGRRRRGLHARRPRDRSRRGAGRPAQRPQRPGHRHPGGGGPRSRGHSPTTTRRSSSPWPSWRRWRWTTPGSTSRCRPARPTSGPWWRRRRWPSWSSTWTGGCGWPTPPPSAPGWRRGAPGGEADAGDRLALHPETAALLGRLAADTLAGQPVTDLEVVARRADGSEVPVSLAGRPAPGRRRGRGRRAWSWRPT